MYGGCDAVLLQPGWGQIQRAGQWHVTRVLLNVSLRCSLLIAIAALTSCIVLMDILPAALILTGNRRWRDKLIVSQPFPSLPSLLLVADCVLVSHASLVAYESVTWYLQPKSVMGSILVPVTQHHVCPMYSITVCRICKPALLWYMLMYIHSLHVHGMACHAWLMQGSSAPE